MARKTLIAGNWKMNGLLEDGVALAKGVAAEVKKMGKPECEFLVCPPFTLLTSVKKALRGAKVALGAQDCHFAEKGAHTGDVSPVMLKDAGCQYVITGHSERRADHGESNELICKKSQAAYDAGLRVISIIAPAMSIACCRLSIWQGPEITDNGRSLPIFKPFISTTLCFSGNSKTLFSILYSF